MNKYYYLTKDNKINIKDYNNNLFIRNNSYYINEILQTENNIESINNNLKSINKEISNLNILIKNFKNYIKMSTITWVILSLIIYYLVHYIPTKLYLISTITGIFIIFRLTTSIIKEYDINKRNKYISKKNYLKNIKYILNQYLITMNKNNYIININDNYLYKIIMLEPISKGIIYK